MDKILNNVLITDNAARKVGIDNSVDLFKLNDCKFKKDWDYSYPTLTQDTGYKDPLVNDTQEKFNENFYKSFPYLGNQAVDMNNIVFAGGAINSHLTTNFDSRHNKYSGDLDAFVYGIKEPVDATTRTADFLSDVYDAYTNYIVKHLILKAQTTYDEKVKVLNAKIADSRKLNTVSGQSRVNEWQEEITDLLVLFTANKNLINDNIDKFVSIKNIRNPNGITVLIKYAKYIRIGPIKINQMFSMKTSDEPEPMKLQVIFRLYNSISEILHGFDLGSSAIGFDCDNTYFTSLSKFAFEFGCNVIIPSRRSPTYTIRLIKYFKRGFQIIMPELDITKLRKDYLKYRLPEIALLPSMAFVYTNINVNKITIRYDNGFLNAPGSEYESDYGFGEKDFDTSDGVKSSIKAFELNVHNIIKESNFLYYIVEGVNGTSIFEATPEITEGKIDAFYDTFKFKLYSRGSMDIKLIEKYIKDSDCATCMVSLYTAKKNGQLKEYLDELITAQKNKTLKTYREYVDIDHTIIPWKVDNPGEQLTASFHPTAETSAEWYGDYYLKPSLVEETNSIITG
jgi:hypothetical protein